MPKETLIYNNSNNNQSKNFIKKYNIKYNYNNHYLYDYYYIIFKKNNAIKHIIQTIVTKFNIAIINKQNNANGTVKTHKKIKRNKKKLKYKTDPINLKFYIIKNKDIITKTIPKKNKLVEMHFSQV